MRTAGLGPLRDLLSAAQETMALLGESLLSAPGEAADLWSRAAASLVTAEGVRAFDYVLVLFLVAAGLEWLFWSYAWPLARSLETAEPRTRLGIYKVVLHRAGIGLFGILLSTLVLFALSTGFTWPGGVQDVVVTAAAGVAMVRLVRLAATALVAPAAPRLRLVQVKTAVAGRLVLAATVVASLLTAALLLPGLLADTMGAEHLPRVLRAAAVAGFGALFVRAAMPARNSDAPPPLRRRRAVPKPVLAAILYGLAVLLWIGGSQRWSLTIAVLVAAFVLQKLVQAAVASVWAAWRTDRAAAARRAGETEEEALEEAASVWPALSQRFARFFVALAGVAVLAWVWDVPVWQMSAVDSPAGRFVARLLGAVALVLVADMVWAAVDGAVTGRLQRIASGGGDPEMGANARLVTLLPLARKATGVVLLTLLVLSLLSVFGIEITPLLAGAGVVGIAVGFGAQTLVRDVLSGVFYLAEDVFRIGDYIEGGSSAKGTVERITLRTVALRHQNGPLHFVPYGVLGAVRNNSRDWVIDKFELPLPVDVESEFVRKMVKKIGQQMTEDPHLAPLIVAPLKAKLYRIEPGVKIFRCKIQTPPGKQFEVRTECYKRIEKALKEAGISFADSRSSIVLQGVQPNGTGGSASAPQPA
jgi:small-conductance mechanosensitive channel